MRKSPRRSLVLLSSDEETPAFVAKSFYHSKGKKSAYLNPLQRQELRKLQTSFTSTCEKAPAENQTLPPKADSQQKLRKKRSKTGQVKRTVKKPGSKLSLRMKVGAEATSTKKRRSPSKRTPRKSPKIAKKGVKLYLQNLRKQQRGKPGRKSKVHGGAVFKSRTIITSRQRQVIKEEEAAVKQPSPASRSLTFVETKDLGEPLEGVDVATGTDAGFEELNCESDPEPNLKRDRESSEEPSPKRAKTTPRKSPRKKRMKTGAESLDLAEIDTGRAGPRRTEEEFEDWLWSPGKLADDMATVESIKNIVQQCLDTPESSTKGVPDSFKNALTSTPKLYPVFTPPATPSTSTPSPSQRKREGALHTPKEKPSTPWERLRDKDGMEQMVLDLGQKYFGAVSCDDCGMVYTATHPEDEANHAKFHRKYLSCTKFNGWKSEDVIEEFSDGRIIVIGPDAPKHAHKKVEEIREIVDRELGFIEGNSLSGKELCKTFLFITPDKKVGGCLISEGISKGYRVIPDQETKELEAQKAWCCETAACPAVCGVSRIWVAGLVRRKKIATRLMEALRNHFSFGSVLTMDDIAFSDPTPDGKLFATAFSKTPQFLVYKYT